MDTLEFVVINSFAAQRFGGNPAAVFPDAGGIPSETTQAIARQMNLVETVFVLPAGLPGADFRLRYFTPEEELPVAGHPTVAACVALARCGRIHPELRQAYRVQTGKGIVNVMLSGSGEDPVVSMEQPAAAFGGIVADRDHVSAVLGLTEDDLLPSLPVAPVDTGLGHLVVPVRSLQALMNIKRNIAPLKTLCAGCGVREVQAFTFEVYDDANRLHTRNICPREGIEDPACGVGNGALAAYLMKYYYVDRPDIEIKAEQGNIVGMPSMVVSTAKRRADGFTVHVGGTGRLMIEGHFHL